jgi:hypothetical protein
LLVEIKNGLCEINRLVLLDKSFVFFDQIGVILFQFNWLEKVEAFVESLKPGVFLFIQPRDALFLIKYALFI